MKKIVYGALAGASLLAMAQAAAAQAQPSAEPAVEAAPESTLGEIVVTARRRSESLQQVPQVVNAVTSDALNKLSIQKFDDVQSVVPGLTLASSNTGYQSGASLRGVTFDVVSGADPTVAMYLNDAPVETNFLFQSMFDIGQIEVLRGPQGTTRGVAAPSGAITLTTRKPNLSEIGGYGSVTATDQHGRNVQGAISVPLIRDMLAVRVAGLLDQDDFDGVNSIHSGVAPRQVTSAVRTSVSFEPNDAINANIVWQHLDKKLDSFTQVTGPGNARNPAIAPSDRVGVQDAPSNLRQHMDVVTAQLDSRVFGQHLSYVGSYSHMKLSSRAAQDLGDLVPGVEFFQRNNTLREQTTHEIRLASDPAPGRFLDYTVGAFYQWYITEAQISQPGTFLPGAFGPPGTFNPAQFNPRYQVLAQIDVPNSYQETSFFGNLTAHLGENTELSAGLRHIVSITNDRTSLTSAPGTIAVQLPVPVPCALAGLSASSYAGFCDAPVPGGLIQDLARRSTKRPTIYNVSLSHRFSRDFLVYANHGTSFRRGVNQVGLFNAENDPALASVIFLQPETSRSYEVGFKSTLFDGRARLNVALYRQTYNDLIFRTAPVPYLSTNGSSASVATTNITANADAVVEGVDVDAAFQVTRELNISAAVSYSDGRVDNDQIPCRDANFDGVPDAGVPTVADFRAAGTALAFCQSTGSVSQNPLWNATIQAEYVRPVADQVDGFVRGLFTYYPENNRQTPALAINPYSLLNLYAGVRSQDGAWEVSLFARNALKTDEITDQGVDPLRTSAVEAFYAAQTGASGYVRSAYTAPREVGVSLRYAFGAR
ncbi:TonB-dependent receptor [Phenylobacterium sp. LjRoot219]|uniref:TonB-dependent receptor n=1 Tax=Phenylobacterium sp. LjRoot219 TaxID=3342283 RepID=UPI003ED0ECF4